MIGIDKWLNRTIVSLLALCAIPSVLSAQGVEDFYRDRQIDMIVVTDTLRADWRFRHDPEWQAFLDQPSAFGYDPIAVPHTDRVIMLRSAVLHTGTS